MGAAADVLGQGLTAIEGAGSQALKFGGDVLGGIGKEAMALPGQIEHGIEGLFGMNKGAGATGANTGPTGASMTNVVPNVEKAAGAVVTPGASSIVAADPAMLNVDPTKVLGDTSNLSTNLFASPTGGPTDQLSAYTMNAPKTLGATVTPPSSILERPAAAPAEAAITPADVMSGRATNPMANPLDQAIGQLRQPYQNIGHVTDLAHQPNAVQGLINNLMGGDTLKYALPAGMLAMNIANATKTPPGVKAMKEEMARAQGERNMLGARTAAEQAGQLPQAAQDTVDRAVQQNIAGIRQKYAAAGMSGSSAEQADIANAQAQGLQESFALGQSMAAQGLQQITGADATVSRLLEQILSAETAQGSELGNTLAELAFMSAGGNPFGRSK